MPRPSSQLRLTPAPRRGSAATSVLLFAVVVALGFAAYLAWQKKTAERAAAEEATARAEAEAQAQAEADTAKRKLEQDLPDIEVVKVEPKVPRIIEDSGNEPNIIVKAPKADKPPVEVLEIKEGEALMKVLTAEKFKYTPTVQNAYLTYAKAKARAELKREGKELPADFLAWAEGNSAAGTIYGAKASAMNVLLWLRSLELDLGRDAVRSKYTQLALATAMVAVADGKTADISPRAPLKLVIPGDPRKPVNTKDKTRTLDMNDHIINFLEDHAPVTGDIVGGMAQALPELVYDSRGIATSLSDKKKKISPTIKRELIAADVLASRKLQQEFNAYMTEKGFPMSLDCGDRVIFPGQTEAIKGDHNKAIADAYKMFRTAYEEKGRLALREQPATYAERCAYLIRNDGSNIPATYGAKKQPVPDFPLTAPWPMLMMLASMDDPLREREELLMRLKKNGEFHTYGEYIGPIAQQGDMQRARRLAPYAFGYGAGTTRLGRDSMQMMIKDGGVCGTMAAMSVATYNMLGIPACTAGQPGHCALISASYDKKSKNYAMVGGQYVTGGHDMTHPHSPFFFADIDEKKPMAWHLSVPFAVNFGEKAFIDSLTAYQLYKALPEDVQQSRGHTVLASAAIINPYNMALADRAITTAPTAGDALRFWETLKAALKSTAHRAGDEAPAAKSDKSGKENKAGQEETLYVKTLFWKLAEHVATLPPPTEPAQQEALKLIYSRYASQVAAFKAALSKASE